VSGFIVGAEGILECLPLGMRFSLFTGRSEVVDFCPRSVLRPKSFVNLNSNGTRSVWAPGSSFSQSKLGKT
jgi:hypothetical protein